MKKKIFLSHPYANNPSLNNIKAETICARLLKQGFMPISPLHLFSCYKNDDDRLEIMEVCKRLIDISDEVHIYGNSPGCREEMAYAAKMGKHIEIMCIGVGRMDLLKGLEGLNE